VVNPKETISIMADFGMGPYAWLRGVDGSRPYVGGNIADTICGFPREYGVSGTLEMFFAIWVVSFERDYDHEAFDWIAWNERGIALSRMLYLELRGRFHVEYHYPCEDPSYDFLKDRIISITVGNLLATRKERLPAESANSCLHD
jgi:hypothetical protein